MRSKSTPSALAVASLAATVVSAGGSSSSCTFSISSTGGISCPAGQLGDGQIRLNGSEPTAYFTINNGQITDSLGRGCIVTGEKIFSLPAKLRILQRVLTPNPEPPTTQVQCDQGKAPAPGFDIAAGVSLTYQGGSKFWACPATDAEYNVYVNPDFGQTKCFPIELSVSGCAAETSCPAASTETVTVTLPPVTLTTTYTVPSCPVEVSSSSLPLSASCSTTFSTLTANTTAVPPPYSTAECHKCNKTTSGLSITQSYVQTSLAASAGWK